jgi:hypothetical protein
MPVLPEWGLIDSHGSDSQRLVTWVAEVNPNGKICRAETDGEGSTEPDQVIFRACQM